VTIDSVATTGTLTSTAIKTEEIKTLMSSLNATIGSAGSIRSTTMSDLINSAYLQEGMNKSQVIELLATEIVGGSYTSFTLEARSHLLIVARAHPPHVTSIFLSNSKMELLLSTAQP
jgi:hypothetical protein